MARKKRKQKRKRKPEHAPYPGWMWMLFGLTIGLSVAFAIFVKYREVIRPVQPVAQEPASMAAPVEAEPAPVAASVEAPVEEPEEEPRFSFYNMLPNFEVIVSEEEPDVSRDTQAVSVEEPGTYVLQAGSFTDAGDADRRRAELALLGIESRVQRVMIDDRTYHRVRIGPTRDLDKLNRMRTRLREAHIDVLRIRLGD
jgi:cell division protein FtsN